MFIVFEGIDGSGKTTQVQLLAERLRADGFDVVTVRDPGSTEAGEKLRKIALYDDIDKMTCFFLFLACRHEMLVKRIKPALEAGKIVISDRFSNSTVAYQGYGRDLGVKMVCDLNTIADEGLIPDLTVMLDLPLDEAIKRVEGVDNFENAVPEFKRRVAEFYEVMKEDNPDWAVIDGTLDVETVHDQIATSVMTSILEKSLTDASDALRELGDAGQSASGVVREASLAD